MSTGSAFERIRHTSGSGADFWLARELGKALGYSTWQKFHAVIEKAMTACANSGQAAAEHFSRVVKPSRGGNNAVREIEEYQLSRYACYLIVQNGDPNKPVIALGQTYFAIFQDHGYRGLYNGESARDIAARKGLSKGQETLDYMGSLELAANLFRSTQAEDKIRREEISTKDEANMAHETVGRLVRRFIIDDLGGTPPEQLPTPRESVRLLEAQERKRLEHMALQPSLFADVVGDDA
ncbi:MAG TPA: BRO family protein [Ktedonobacterales bacterium]|nr:BRO family protein [Ktedonobacterales bacterium]